MIDLATARETFESSTDGTVGIEEEFALLDPDTHLLVPRFEALRDAARPDPVLTESIAGELISSEIEIRSGRGEDAEDARARQADRRRRLFTLAAAHGVALGSTGTHPLSDYRDQHVIDTEHYHRVEDGLKYVAWRNNTFSVHVHVGVRGADRAVQVCDRLRPVLPMLLAISANSPYVDRHGLGSAHRAHADLHEVVPALRRAGRVRLLAGVGGLRRAARAHALDRRVHPAVVVRAPAPRLRHRRGAHLRRADDRAGGRPARRADRGVRAPRRRGDRRGRDAARGARPPDRGEHVAGDPLRPRRRAAGPARPADRALSRRRGAGPAEGLDRRRRGAPRAQRRPAPAPDDRCRRRAGRGVRRGRARDATRPTSRRRPVP